MFEHIFFLVLQPQKFGKLSNYGRLITDIEVKEHASAPAYEVIEKWPPS